MSKTIRVSSDLYDVLDEYREKDETFQDVIEELATEAGLFPDQINSAGDLERKLRVGYGYEPGELQQVLDALRFVYTGQEKKNTIGVPHAAADERYQDELDALKRLKLVREKHYTGKYDYGYRTTAQGEKIGSELVRNMLDERAREIEAIFDEFDDTLLSVLIKFGFEKTGTGHLTDRGAVIGRKYGPELWDISELDHEYRELKQKLENVGVASRYNLDPERTVLPPEFNGFLKEYAGAELRPVMKQVEIYQILLDYTRGELETREEIFNNLDTASEEDLKAVVDKFNEKGLTSRYLPSKDAPLLIKDSQRVRETIEQEMKKQLNLG